MALRSYQKSFDEAIEGALSLEGKRFSPLLTTRLRDKTVVEKIRQTFVSARHEAYRQLYEADAKQEDDTLF